MARSIGIQHREMSLGQKLRRITWGLAIILTITTLFGLAMLYSAANGNLDPWASRQAIRYAAGLVIMVGIALVDIRLLLRWSYGIYGVAVLLLVLVEIMGISYRVGWIDIWPI